jgi:hypothetical protein
MKPYRVPPSRAPSPVEPSSPDFGRFEQLCIYALLAIAAFALAVNEIKIP